MPENERHIIIGTAGHIDHGKTSLIKALTGIDCDTHKDEKLRGITINLGFAHLKLPNGNKIGIVDVPGHKNFVNTMVAGASGIDFVIMVIAADSGIMPQTVEHLKIMEILGINKGMVVLTKIDLVDEEIILITEDEINDFCKNTFLENSEILKVSTKTGEGIQELKNYLLQLQISNLENFTRPDFRMFIDRIFTVTGHGTVVNGSVIGGDLIKGTNVYLLPSEKELRVRRMERYGEEVGKLRIGDRASLNLVGLNSEEFRRGMLISDKKLKSSTILDAKLFIFQRNYELKLWSQIIFLLGTFQTQAKLHLIDSDVLRLGESGIVQIHLDEPCVAQFGDRFVIRNTSGDTTIGGGKIIDAHPLHHRKRPKELIQNLAKISGGEIRELINAEVKKSLSPISTKSIAQKLNIHLDEVHNAIKIDNKLDLVIITSGDQKVLLRMSSYNEIKNKILKAITNFHKRNPLYLGGKTTSELCGLFGANRTDDTDSAIEFIIEKLEGEKKLKRVQNSWAFQNHSVTLTPEDEKQIKFVEEYHKNSGMQTPLMSELINQAGKQGIEENKLRQILHLLTTRKKLYNIDGNFIHSTIVDRSRTELLRNLLKRGGGATVADFRDFVKGNRKICLLMINQFDKEGITFRESDLRFITEEGKKLIKSKVQI